MFVSFVFGHRRSLCTENCESVVFSYGTLNQPKITNFNFWRKFWTLHITDIIRFAYPIDHFFFIGLPVTVVVCGLGMSTVTPNKESVQKKISSILTPLRDENEVSCRFNEVIPWNSNQLHGTTFFCVGNTFCRAIIDEAVKVQKTEKFFSIVTNIVTFLHIIFVEKTQGISDCKIVLPWRNVRRGKQVMRFNI